MVKREDLDDELQAPYHPKPSKSVLSYLDQAFLSVYDSLVQNPPGDKMFMSMVPAAPGSSTPLVPSVPVVCSLHECVNTVHAMCSKLHRFCFRATSAHKTMALVRRRVAGREVQFMYA